MLIDGGVALLDTSGVTDALVSAIWDRSGGTFNLSGVGPLDRYTRSDETVPTSLYAVGVDGVELILDYELATSELVEAWVGAVLAQYPQAEWFGVWHNEGRAVLDFIVLYQEYDAAVSRGQQESQSAIFDLVADREVTLA